jgi:hypothetical protein
MVREQQIINSQIYLSSRRAAEIARYSADYIGQLCRESRVNCQRINGKWYVEKSSLLRHRNEAVRENETSFQPLVFSSKSNLKVRPSNKSASFLKVVTSVFAVVFVFIGSFSAASYVFSTNTFRSLTQKLSGNVFSAIDPVAVFSDGANDSSAGTTNAGLVVVPASSSTVENSELVKSIENTFSDPVVVHQTNVNSGTITPVFRNVKGHDYLYVLVPVQASSSNTQ